jgi:chitodextrinase
MPASFTAAPAGSTGANLSWNAATDNIGVKDYIVRRNGAQMATPATTSYLDTGLSPGQTYSYTVAARDAAGNTSPDTPSQSVTTPVPPPVDTSPPSVPSNLVATPGSNAIGLSWSPSTDNVQVTGYVVRRNGTPVATIPTAGYVDTGLSASTTYTFTVSAVDAAANASAQSAPVTATTLASGTGSALAQLAASLQPGQWVVPFVMGGLNASLPYAQGPSTLSMMGFSARGHWDPIHKKLQFAGTSHTGGLYIDGAGALLTWDDATNQWTKESYTWSVWDPGHSYYHVALNKTNGDLYYRSFNSANIYRRAYGSTGQASWQAGQVANHPNRGNAVAGGLEWFPQLNGGAGGLVFVDVLGASWSNAALTSWNSTPTLMSGQIHNWVVAAGGFVYWGGGSDMTAMYRLSSTGISTTMPDTPLGTGVNSNSSIVLAHPNGTDLLLFGTSAGGPIFRFDGASWTNVGTHQIGGQLWAGFTIPEYGIILFLRHENLGTGNGSAVVFKP